MPLSEEQELELERIRSDDPELEELNWGGTLVQDGGLDDTDMQRLAGAISSDLTLRNHHLRSISIRNNAKIKAAGVRSLIAVLPHSMVVAVDSMNVRIPGQVRQDLKDAIAENAILRLAGSPGDRGADEQSVDHKAAAAVQRDEAQREKERQVAVVHAAAARDQQQRSKGCVASMPVTLRAHALRPTVTDSAVEWQPTEEVDQEDEHPLTENSRRVIFRGALTDVRPQLDARRRHKQHRIRAEETEPIERRNRNRKRAESRQPPKAAALHEQGRPVVCGRRGRPVAPEKVVSAKELRQRTIMRANAGGHRGTLLHVAARGTIMTKPVRAGFHCTSHSLCSFSRFHKTL